MLRTIFWIITFVFGIVKGTMLSNGSALGDVDYVTLALRMIFFTFFSLVILRRVIRGTVTLFILFIFIVLSVFALDRYMEVGFIPWWIAICTYLYLPSANLRTNGIENSQMGNPN